MKEVRDIDISVIITAHGEGLIAGFTAKSANAAIEHAQRELGLTAETILILDRADETTSDVLANALTGNVRVVETDTGDPGQARNHGIKLAKGTCSAFLDGDDLWSTNWLTESWKLIKERPDCVGQSHCNVVFGERRLIWWHVDSEGPLYDPHYLVWSNYWDAMSFARTQIYRDIPFKANNLKLGFGHEDWHWSCVTVERGIPHKPVPNTIHFKRRRKGSQMDLVAKAGATVWPRNINIGSR